MTWELPPLFDALIALLIFLLSGAIGIRLMRRFPLDTLSPIERGLFAFTLGLGVVSYLPFALFALHIGKPPVVIAAFLVLSLALCREQFRVLRYFAGQIAQIPKLPRPFLIFLLIFAPLLLVTFFQALCPPTDPDGLHYHLTAPLAYLREGRFFYMPTFLHLNWPLGIELLFAIGMAFHHHFAAGIIQYGLGLVLMIALYQLAVRLTSTDWKQHAFSLLGCITVAVSFTFIRGEMTWAYIDLGLGLYTTMAGYALLLSWQAIQNRQEIGAVSPYWTLAAVCAGLAATAKLPGLFTIIIVALMILGQSRAVSRSEGIASLLRPAIRGLMIGIAVSLPWFVRSWLQTRTPIYPYFGSLLGVVDWSPAFQARLNEYLQYFNTLRTRHLTPAQIVQVRAAVCAVLVLIGSFVCLVPRWKLGRPLLFYVVALTFVQVATSGIYVRYFLPYLPLIVLMSIWCVRELLEPKPVRLLILSLLCLWLWGLHKLPARLRWEAASLVQAGKVASGVTSRDEYLTSQLPGYAMAKWCNTHLAPDKTVVLGIYDAHASLYENKTLTTHYWLQDAIRYDSDQQTQEDLKRLGVDYLILNETPADPAALAGRDKESILRDEQEFPKLKRAAREYGTKIHTEGGYVLYQMNW